MFMVMAHCQSLVIIVNESFATLCDGNPWSIETEALSDRKRESTAMRISGVVGGDVKLKRN